MLGLGATDCTDRSSGYIEIYEGKLPSEFTGRYIYIFFWGGADKNLLELIDKLWFVPPPLPPFKHRFTLLE